jgi:hypothetical protein
MKGRFAEAQQGVKLAAAGLLSEQGADCHACIMCMEDY